MRPMPANTLVLVASPKAADEVIAAWQRVLPEDDVFYHTDILQDRWKGDAVYTFRAENADYIETLAAIIDETLDRSVPRLVRTF